VTRPVLVGLVDPDKVTPLKDEAASKAYLSKPASGQ